MIRRRSTPSPRRADEPSRSLAPCHHHAANCHRPLAPRIFNRSHHKGNGSLTRISFDRDCAAMSIRHNFGYGSSNRLSSFAALAFGSKCSRQRHSFSRRRKQFLPRIRERPRKQSRFGAALLHLGPGLHDARLIEPFGWVTRCGKARRASSTTSCVGPHWLHRVVPRLPSGRRSWVALAPTSLR
jgi:hypothetical protein